MSIIKTRLKVTVTSLLFFMCSYWEPVYAEDKTPNMTHKASSESLTEELANGLELPIVARKSSKLTNSKSLAFSDTLPEGLSFVGLVNKEWRVFINRYGTLLTVSDLVHPRSTAYHASSQKLAYVSVDNRLLERDLTDNTIAELSRPDSDNRYTQPHYSRDGQWLFVVEMPKGKSRTTKIVGFNRQTGDKHIFVRKRTAQFEPFLHDEQFLYYTTAICVDDCGGMIWELWRRDMFTAKQQQLTLINAIATQPHVGDDGWLYYSANADKGRFHIWRMQPEIGAPPEQVTTGDVRDSEPTTDAAGNLYFLRKNRHGAQLMKLSADGTLLELSTDKRLIDIRNLEISR